MALLRGEIMNKKGVEVSINAIIIAIIALLVLVVLAIIFTGKLGSFSQQSAQCATKGGLCAPVGNCGAAETKYAKFGLQDATTVCPDASDGSRQVCCLPISK